MSLANWWCVGIQAFITLLLFGGFNLSNWAFGLLRSTQPSHPSHPHPQQQYQQQDFPQTPHRVPSNPMYVQHNNDAYLQNWHQQQQYTPYAAATPAHEGGVQRIEAPPPLLHSQSLPAGVPTVAAGGSGTGMGGEEVKTPRRRGMFR